MGNNEKLKFILKKIFDLGYYNEKIDNIKYCNSNVNQSTNESWQKINTIQSSGIEYPTSNNGKREVENKYYILDFDKIIGYHNKGNPGNDNDKNKKTKYTAEFITQTEQYYISAGTDLQVYIYDKSYSIKKVKNKIEDWVYNAIEDNSQIILCSKNSLYIISDKKHKETEEKTLNQIFLINYTNRSKIKDYCFCCEDEICFYNDIFSKILSEEKYTIRKDILLKSGIKINNNLLIFYSNKIVSKGNDKLYAYYTYNLNELKDIEFNEEYSFVFTANGMAIMPFNNDEEENKVKINYKPKYKNKLKVLLCACKKYLRKQKNGILLLNIQIDKNNYEFKAHFFFNTGTFEVYCICPLLKCKNESVINDKIEIEDTFYFLVGGFNPNKNKSVIKLFKLDYNEESFVKKIEFIQDVYTDNKYFKGPISCITQSKSDNKILITCWDGSVYLFNKPEIDFYLKENENLKFDSFFKKTKIQELYI